MEEERGGGNGISHCAVVGARGLCSPLSEGWRHVRVGIGREITEISRRDSERLPEATSSTYIVSDIKICVVESSAHMHSKILMYCTGRSTYSLFISTLKMYIINTAQNK